MITALPELGGEEREQGSKPLSTGEEEVLGDLGEVGVVGRSRLEQTLFDPGQGVPDTGDANETLEVVHS
jgi:hypothetical protein